MSGSNAAFVGNLGQDIEVRHTTNSVVANTSIAVRTGFGDREITTWWRLAFWGKQAEVVAKHFQKGDGIIVFGEVYIREYEAKDGTTGKSAEMNVRDFAFSPGGKKKVSG